MNSFLFLFLYLWVLYILFLLFWYRTYLPNCLPVSEYQFVCRRLLLNLSSFVPLSVCLSLCAFLRFTFFLLWTHFRHCCLCSFNCTEESWVNMVSIYRIFIYLFISILWNHPIRLSELSCFLFVCCFQLNFIFFLVFPLPSPLLSLCLCQRFVLLTPTFSLCGFLSLRRANQWVYTTSDFLRNRKQFCPRK